MRASWTASPTQVHDRLPAAEPGHRERYDADNEFAQVARKRVLEKKGAAASRGRS
jgi:hypothetical protein